MPGQRSEKTDGFIRTHELLEELKSDIDRAYQTLENDKQSRYLRRCVVRAIFSYIEAIIECIKVKLRCSVRSELYTGTLTDTEVETLGPLAVIGAVEPGKFLPIDQNIKRTFKLAAKIWLLKDFQLRTGDEDFQDFLKAKSARNKLTHPRTFYDIEVTDYDMHCHTIAGMWLQLEFTRLMKLRLKSLIKEEV